MEPSNIQPDTNMQVEQYLFMSGEIYITGLRDNCLFNHLGSLWGIRICCRVCLFELSWYLNRLVLPMSDIPACPECNSSYAYEDRDLYVCPECAHEWPQQGAPLAGQQAGSGIVDANGNPLADGDSVTVIKDLKVKGSSSTVKVGTKVKNIRLVEGDHDIDCKIDGIGAMKLKSKFVKKA